MFITSLALGSLIVTHRSSRGDIIKTTSYASHNHLVRQTAVICKEAGFNVTSHCGGYLGTDHERGGRYATSDHIADLVITGMCTNVKAVLADATMVHTVGGSVAAAGRVMPTCARKAEGACVGENETEKMKHYINLGQKHRVAIIALACETHGGMGPRFLDFIAEVAEHATSKMDSLDHDNEAGEAAKTRASYARQPRLRWLRLISLTRVRTIAERLGIGIGGESGSSGHTIPGLEGSLRGRFNWAPSGGLNGGSTVGV